MAEVSFLVLSVIGTLVLSLPLQVSEVALNNNNFTEKTIIKNINTPNKNEIIISPNIQVSLLVKQKKKITFLFLLIQLSFKKHRYYICTMKATELHRTSWVLPLQWIVNYCQTCENFIFPVPTISSYFLSWWAKTVISGLWRYTSANSKCRYPAFSFRVVM